MATLSKNIGLAETEAKVYEALLSLGPSLVSDISRKSGISRTLGYHVLEKLAVAGLVSRVSGERKRLRYSANHPQSLMQYVKNRSNLWQRRVDEVERLLPDLVSLYKVAEKPVIKYQEGAEGVKAIYWQTLESREEILSILDIEGWDVSELQQWGKQYNAERSRHKIYERILILDTLQGREWMKDYHGSFTYTDYRWITAEQLPAIVEFGGEINIYENKVVMALLKKPNLMGVMIESSALTNLLKGLYELAWHQARPVRPVKKSKQT